MPNFIDRTGMRFGRLTVLRLFDAPGSQKSLRWECQCDCGAVTHPRGSDLATGKTQACGCLQREVLVKANTKHGRHGSAEYFVWKGMLSRCYNSKSRQFDDYGGRGISVCDEWRNDFPAFVRDVGFRPSASHSIERMDNDGNYESGNCYWATRVEQANNKRSTHLIEVGEETLSVAQAARAFGLNANSLYQKIIIRGSRNMHFSGEAALREFYKNRSDNGRGEA